MFQLVAVFVFISSMWITGARAQDLACQEVPADILFLLDSSGSIKADDFKKQLTFAADLTSKFDLGPKVVQIAVMTFADSPVVRFSYNKYTDNDALYKAILKIHQDRGQTYTDSALRDAKDFIFNPSQGARSGAPLAKVVIVMTDGQSLGPAETKKEAGLLKDAGALVLSIGIGDDVKKQELEDIASNSDSVFEVANFDALEAIKSSLIAQTCEEVLTNQCASLDDVILVIQSGGLTETTFKQELGFVANLTKGFQLGSTHIRVGAVTYGTSPRKEFDLITYNTNKDLSQAILSSSYSSGSINTAEALRFITQQGMFNKSAGGRRHRNATQIVIVVTNGPSVDLRQTVQAAKELKEKGVLIMAIGTGSANRNELLLVASEPRMVFQEKSYEVLSRIYTTIAETYCEERKKPWDFPNSVKNCNPDEETGVHLKDLIIEQRPNQHGCSSFIAIIKCPNGFFYDQNEKKCLDKVLFDTCRCIASGRKTANIAIKNPWSLKKSVEKSCVEPIAETGELFKDLIVDLVPVESGCSNFMAEIRCPRGLVYDLEKMLCRDPVLVENCTITTGPTTKCSITSNSLTKPKNAASDLVYPPVVVLCLCILINHLLHKRLLLGVGGHGVPGRLLDMGLQQTGPMLTQTS